MNAASTEFLRRLWGDQLPDDARIALWEKATKESHYLASPAEASRFDGATDLYVSAALVPAGLSPHSRLKAQEAVAIAGVWLDIDIDGGPDNKQGAAPDMDAAVAVAHAVLEPTILVNSGYGLHSWWLFDEPWVFADNNDRELAQRVTRGWQTLHRQAASFRLDSTFDLARLMRLPGTLNGKGTP